METALIPKDFPAEFLRKKRQINPKEQFVDFSELIPNKFKKYNHLQ